MKAEEKMKSINRILSNTCVICSDIIYDMNNFTHDESGVENLSVWILKDATLDVEPFIDMILNTETYGYQYERTESEHYIYLMFVFY